MLCNKKSLSSGSGGAEEDEKVDVNIDLILVAGLDRGLRMDDTERLTIGMWIDYIVEWNNVRVRSKEKIDKKTGKPIKIRRANQTDFDMF